MTTRIETSSDVVYSCEGTRVFDNTAVSDGAILKCRCFPREGEDPGDENTGRLELRKDVSVHSEALHPSNMNEEWRRNGLAYTMRLRDSTENHRSRASRPFPAFHACFDFSSRISNSRS